MIVPKTYLHHYRPGIQNFNIHTPVSVPRWEIWIWAGRVKEFSKSMGICNFLKFRRGRKNTSWVFSGEAKNCSNFNDNHRKSPGGLCLLKYRGCHMLSAKCRGFKLFFTSSGGEKVPKRLSMGMAIFLVGMEIRCFLSAGDSFFGPIFHRVGGPTGSLIQGCTTG